MKKHINKPLSLTFDLSKSLGYQLYCLPDFWDNSQSEYPYREEAYVLHLTALSWELYSKC